jgi:hypothetical protein
MEYNWIYTNWNDNIYILLLIIIILGLIIIDFGLLKRKTDRFYDIQSNTSTTIPKITGSNINIPNITIPNITIPNITMPKINIPNMTIYNMETSNMSTPNTTVYQPPTLDNPMNPSFYISNEEEARRNAWSQLDGDEGSLNNTNGSKSDILSYQTNVTQSNSTLFNISNSTPQSKNYATLGDYATLDSIGTTLTDTLGGIKSDLGYTILDDQLGTFNNYSTNYNNPHTYDNTANFKTGMNPSTVNGTSKSITGIGSGLSGKFTQDNKPIFLQKDFQGVANIFAPNIIISNPPLTSDGNPDISFQM